MEIGAEGLRARRLGYPRSGTNSFGFDEPAQHDLTVISTKVDERWKKAVPFRSGFVGLLKVEENGQLSEGYQSSRGLVVPNLAGVFLVGFVPAVVGFAFNAPMAAADG